ncbi:hypothetical protein K461DRAFT_178127 [Myriangium duriaei CBS 260.36]|uniref:Zn(2)-C6 fungal-type domain-containing protein n=1 Tax=Myriangium duriaei CBS 260.36 TaxID=1168546 RepID=A0A9P4MI22_9PEZI|nr:hypothetical protein K461DRAFT_178127 [Myriangium duriaei CBS 260.36]
MSPAHRVAVACLTCRRSKLKCSGTQPCDRCQKRSRTCVFDESDEHPTPTVPRQLIPRPPQVSTPRPSRWSPQRGARRSPSRLALQSAPSPAQQPAQRPVSAQAAPVAYIETTGPSAGPATTPATTTAAPSDADPSTCTPLYQKNRLGRPRQRRRWLYLGASSTWSFNLQVFSMVRGCIDYPYEEPIFTLDRDAYDISWTRLGPNDQTPTDRLPSRDYAIYLFDTVKYHLGMFFSFIDEESFKQCLHDFYAGNIEDTRTCRLWMCQLFLVLAFGKGFLNQKKAHREPPGGDYFCRAMANLPEIHLLHEEPNRGAQVLALISLYFYCMDMRQTAYSYIGQALRLFLVEGNHTNIKESRLEPQLAESSTNIWWSIYVLDRTLTSALGTPISIHDSAIQNTLPEIPSKAFHVRLCRMIAHILTDLYNADGSLEPQYLSKVKAILQSLAGLGEEIDQSIAVKVSNSLDAVTKIDAHLRLMWHQCVILATRPLLLVLLSRKIRVDAEQYDPPPTVHELVLTCARSCKKTLNYLSSLSDNNMLDSFLPFDMDFTTTAASALIVIKHMLNVEYQFDARAIAARLFGEMIASGNNAAQLRLQEIDRMHELGLLFRQGRQPQITSDPIDLPSLTSSDLEQNFGLAQEDMLSLADRLDPNAFFEILDTDAWGGEWLDQNI